MTDVKEKNRVCPPKSVRRFDNWLRPLIHSTRKLFGKYVEPGMTALDVGCGRGFATIGLARLVGKEGCVIAADLQMEMLEMVRARARKKGFLEIIDFHQCREDSINLNEKVDFAVAFWLVHEVPDASAFLEEVFSILNPGSCLFVAEPKMHVSRNDFEKTIELAVQAGFTIEETRRVLFSRTVVLRHP